MNRLFYNILIFSFAVLLGGVIMIFSVRPTDDYIPKAGSQNTLIWKKLNVSGVDIASMKVTEDVIDVSRVKVSQDTPILVDFGRLSSFMYLAPAGAQTGLLDKKSATGIVLGDISGIISLYDLFTLYTIFDVNNLFRLEQITNGSFYIGKEKDGKIAIYAIDGVTRLVFIDGGKDMTNMLLFPGSYIRFDPSRNKSLKNVDLFRTILSLKDTDNEVFEFVNPRVNIGDEQDAFFNYRLPKKSMILFRILSSRFKEKVEMIDLERYKSFTYNANTNQSMWLMNPSKKNHNMLLELSSLLSRAISTNTNSEDLVVRIGKLYNQAKNLDISNATAKNLVEQFLLDGRFALYGGISNVKYQERYEDIAKIIGIEPTNAQSKLLQDLANIYSKNLFTQKKSNLTLNVDTYSPTSLKLLETIDKNEIEKKDNFDIAIYAFNILKKMEERTLQLPVYIMEDISTYNYFIAFFRASTRYISSIDDVARKEEAIMGFSNQYYDAMLSMIVNSLYKTFIIEENGALFVDGRFRDTVKVTISQEILDSVDILYDIIQEMALSIDALWPPTGNKDTYTQKRIKNNILRFEAFRTIINPKDYVDYVKSPYKVQSGSIYHFPQINEENGDFQLIRVDPAIIENLNTARVLSSDPRILELKKIWPDADASIWSVDNNDIRFTKAPYIINRNINDNSLVYISGLYSKKMFQDISLFYETYQIRINTPQMSQAVFYEFLTRITYYLDSIDEVVQNAIDPTNIGEITIIPSLNRITVGGSVYTIAIKD